MEKKQGLHTQKCEMQTVSEEQWLNIHPKIMEAARKLYLDECYAQAIQAAFAVLNQQALVLGTRLRADGRTFEGVSAAELTAQRSRAENGRKADGSRTAEESRKIRNFAFRQIMFASELMTKLDEADQ